MSRTLLEELNELHASYVVAINQAVADGELRHAEELAANYDSDAIELIAEREGKTHLLPIQRPAPTESPLRRLLRRTGSSNAA